MNKDELNQLFAKRLFNQFVDNVIFYTTSDGDEYFLVTKNGTRFLVVNHIVRGERQKPELVYVV